MMRKGCLLLILSLTGAGCLTPGSNVEQESRQVPQVPLREAPPPPAVTVDQVTDTNAPDIVQAMKQEMDFETKSQPATTAADPMKR